MIFADGVIERSICRLCESTSLQKVYDFGDMPLANELLIHKGEIADEYPLRFYVCLECGLGQVDDVVPPSRIFSDYRYLSSASSTFLSHARNFAQFCIDQELIESDSYVLEIASNDGYLLSIFRDLGIRVLGIEPASNVAILSEQKGIPTLNEFFGKALALRLKEQFGFPKLIVANNVLAHVPDLIDFMEGLAAVCGPETVISVENPSILGILNGNQFDTIYHEHFSYLSVTSMERLVAMFGLKITALHNLQIHGGSNRYFITQADSTIKVAHDSLAVEKKNELSSGLKSEESWSKVSQDIQSSIDGFSHFLCDGDTPVLGYGAAAKASTLLNSTSASKNRICAILDLGNEKQSRFVPRDNIPVISPLQIPHFDFQEIVIFPWNIVAEIRNTLEEFGFSHLKTHTFVPHHIQY